VNNPRTHFFDSNRTEFLLPDQEWSGVRKNIPLSSGMFLVVTDCVSAHDTTIEFELDSPPLSIGFILSGSSHTELQYDTGKRESIAHTAHGTEVCYLPGGKGTCRMKQGVPFRSVSVVIPPDSFRTAFRGLSRNLPAAFSDIANGDITAPYRFRNGLSPEMVSTVHQILDCPYTGALEQAYLNAKAMELLIYQLAAMKNRAQAEGRLISPEDEERIRKAEQLISEDVACPLSTADLARTVGVNECKLKKGFRLLFNTTVRGLRTTRRFEKAAWLLSESDMTVGEIAEAVGYSDIKHFYAMFRERYGMPPGAYRSQFTTFTVTPKRNSGCPHG